MCNPYCAQSTRKQLIMSTENTSLTNDSPALESNTTDDIIIGKSNTYQRSFLIVAGSLLALLVCVAVAGKIGGQPFKSSAHEIAEGAVALADYQVDSANLRLTKDIFGLDAGSQNDKGEIKNRIKKLLGIFLPS